MDSKTRRGLAQAFLGALFSASFLVPWKLAMQHGETELAVLVLVTSAAALNSLALLVRGPAAAGTASDRRVLFSLAVVLALLTLIGNYCSAEAIARISGALLAVLQRSEVIVVALLGGVLLRERVQPVFWFGSALSLLGLVVLNQPQGSARFEPAGVLYGVGAAVSFGTLTVLVRKYIARVQPLTLNALRLWFSAALWFVAERRIPSVSEFSPQLLLYASLAALCGPFLSRFAFLVSARSLPANMTAFAGLLTPVVALPLGYVLIHDVPTPRELGGGLIMLVGIAIPLLAPGTGRASPPPSPKGVGGSSSADASASTKP